MANTAGSGAGVSRRDRAGRRRRDGRRRRSRRSTRRGRRPLTASDSLGRVASSGSATTSSTQPPNPTSGVAAVGGAWSASRSISVSSPAIWRRQRAGMVARLAASSTAAHSAPCRISHSVLPSGWTNRSYADPAVADVVGADDAESRSRPSTSSPPTCKCHPPSQRRAEVDDARRHIGVCRARGVGSEERGDGASRCRRPRCRRGRPPSTPRRAVPRAPTSSGSRPRFSNSTKPGALIGGGRGRAAAPATRGGRRARAAGPPRSRSPRRSVARRRSGCRTEPAGGRRAACVGIADLARSTACSAVVGGLVGDGPAIAEVGATVVDERHRHVAVQLVRRERDQARVAEVQHAVVAHLVGSRAAAPRRARRGRCSA